MSIVSTLARGVSRLLGGSRRRKRRPRASAVTGSIHNDHDHWKAVSRLLAGGRSPSGIASLLRELRELETPALYIQITQESAPDLVLETWEGRSIRMVLGDRTIQSGSGATEGSAAHLQEREIRIPGLFTTAPDHPLIYLAVQGGRQGEYVCQVPAYITHVTIVANGKLLARAQPVNHDRWRHRFPAA